MSTDIQLSAVAEMKWQTHREKCCLFQEDKRERAWNAHLALHTEHDGYKYLATNCPLFHKLNVLPIHLDPKRLENGSGIEITLRQNNAKYHQSCRMMFNNTKLGCAQKRAMSHKSSQEAEAGPSECTRRSISSVRSEKDFCAFSVKKNLRQQTNGNSSCGTFHWRRSSLSICASKRFIYNSCSW